MGRTGTVGLTEKAKQPKPVLGILGGVASGKSTVARCYAALGAALLDGDAAGHKVLAQPEVRDAIRSHWGDAVFGPDGQVDRRALAKLVFGPPSKGSTSQATVHRKHLEQITHPRIKHLLNEQLQRNLADDDVRAIVLDAAVMIEAGWEKMCDTIVFVDASRDARLRRALSRGWSERQFEDREAAQASLPRKRGLADVTIHNNGSPDDLRDQVRQHWQRLFPD